MYIFRFQISSSKINVKKILKKKKKRNTYNMIIIKTSKYFILLGLKKKINKHNVKIDTFFSSVGI